MTSPQLPARRSGRAPGELQKLDDSLEPEVRSFVLQLRDLFEMLETSVSRYAYAHYLNKGVVSRYLSGMHIPPRPFLDQLLDEQPSPVTEEARIHIYDLHLTALGARDNRALRVQKATDRLNDALADLKHARLQVRYLEQALASREQDVQDLSERIAEMEQSRASERNRSEEELAHYRNLQAELTEQRDALMTEAAEIRQQLDLAEYQREQIEARCEDLQLALELSEDAQRQQPTATPQSAPVIWGNMPPRNHRFVGRDDILIQLGALGDKQPDRNSPYVLIGMLGSGKTQIAIEYAYRSRSKYDLVWWIPADQMASVRANLAQLASRMGIESATTAGIDGAVAAAMDALRRGEPYSRWLLIFDNADNPEELLDFIISDGPGHILITTANPRWQMAGEIVPVREFDRDDSLDFLRANTVMNDIDILSAGRFARELGDLPIALDQAASLLNSGLSMEGYLDILQNDPTSVLAEGKPLSYPTSLMAGFAMAISATNSQDPRALDVLGVFSWFAPESIPLRIFIGHGEASGLPEVFSNPIRLSRALHELRRFSLAEVDQRARTVRMHRLIRLLYQADRTDDQKADYLNTARTLLASSIPKDADNRPTLGCCAEIAPHLESLRIAESRDANVRDFCLHAVRCLAWSGLHDQSRALAKRCLELWVTDSEPGDPLVAELESLLREADDQEPDV